MLPRESRPSLPLPVAWLVLFALVLTHLPAVGFDFAGRDFESLSFAAGGRMGEGWPSYPWSSWVVWSLQWPLLRTDPAGYHLSSLIALALTAVLVARMALRMGSAGAGAAIAGLLVALGPCAWLAVAWTTAAAEIWAMLFAVAALDLWVDRRAGARPLFAALLAGLALLSSASAIGVVVLLAWAQRSFLGALPAPTRRARRFLLVLLAGGALLSALWSTGLIGSGPGLAARPPLTELTLRSADAIWPWAARLSGGLAHALGLLTLAAWVTLAVVRHREGDRRLWFCGAWALLTLLPALLLNDRTLAHHGLGMKIAASWALALVLGPAIERLLEARGASAALRGAALALAFVVTSTVGAIGVQRVTHARGADGRLVDPILHLTSITADVRQQLSALQRAHASAVGTTGPGRLEHILVLQAARVVLPEDLAVPDQAEIILRTPAHAALRGERGLRLLLGDGIQARWVTHLDDAPRDAMVLLDVGDDRLRVLGPVENARIYSALIAVAAGQYSRGRHDLWHVISLQGERVRFAFDPDSLPIEPGELDAEAAGFAGYLAARDEPSSYRVLRLFEQIYEEIRGRELVRDFDETMRAPRME